MSNANILEDCTPAADDDNPKTKCRKIHPLGELCVSSLSFHPEQVGSSSSSSLRLTAPSPTEEVEDAEHDTQVDITNIDPRAVDAMLAHELQKLSFQHREAVNEVSEHQEDGARVLVSQDASILIHTLSFSSVPFFLVGNSWRSHPGSSRDS
jgi:hypothetical protein